MRSDNKNKLGWKKKMLHRMINYYIYFIYLVCFFSVFTLYRKLVLAKYNIDYMHFWFNVIEAMVLAKVIMIAEVFNLGSRLNGKPLIYPSIYKTFVFTLCVCCFEIAEHTISGLVKGNSLFWGFNEIMSVGWHELLARCLVTFFAFIPFFAFKELGRMLGEGRLRKIFFESANG